MKLSELRILLKENGIKGYSHYNKPELINILIEKGHLENEIPILPQKKEIDEKHNYLKKIRNAGKQVEVIDKKTGEVKTYPSIYNCARAFKINPGAIYHYNGKTYKEQYEINIM